MSNSIRRNAQYGSFTALLKPVAATPVLGKIIRTAAEVEQIKTDAKEEGFEQGHVNGFAAGFAAGEPAGYQAGVEQGQREYLAQKDEELAAFTAALEQTVQSIQNSMHAWYAESTPALAHLSALIASRIVARELRLDQTTVVDMTREAITEVTHATSARVKVNPFDVPVLVEHQEEIRAAAASVKHLEIVEDPSILSGCIIESDGGIVDATLDMKIGEVLKGLREAS